MLRLLCHYEWMPIEFGPKEPGNYLVSYGSDWREARYDPSSAGWYNIDMGRRLETPAYWAVVHTPDQIKIKRLVINLASMDAHVMTGAEDA